MRRLCNVAYAMVVPALAESDRRHLDSLLREMSTEERPTVTGGTGRSPSTRTRVPEPVTAQESTLAARGKRPPPWWPGAAVVATESRIGALRRGGGDVNA